MYELLTCCCAMEGSLFIQNKLFVPKIKELVCNRNKKNLLGYAGLLNLAVYCVNDLDFALFLLQKK